jgi:predicted  nucleic acid-binding Zn-ribbon protein
MEHDETIRDLQRSLERATEQRDSLRKALQNIENVIIEEEKMPSYHKVVMKRHREEWGTLHKAIDDAIKVLHHG